MMILGDKPEQGTQAEASQISLFAGALREIGWLDALTSLDKDTVLVVDPEVRRAIEAEAGLLTCHTRKPGTLGQPPEGVVRILYLCRENEWFRVKAARRRFPELQVVSLTYDVLPLGSLPDNRITDDVWQGRDRDVVPPRNLLMTSRGSDAEYLKLALEKNKFPSIKQMVPRALEPWILLVNQFQASRFFATVFGGLPRADTAYSVDIYLLHLLFEHANLTQDRLVNWLSTNEAHMLYFLTRDKLRQVSLRVLLERQHMVSLWDRSAASVAALTEQRFDLQKATEELEIQLELEVLVEKPMEGQSHFKILSLEDLVIVPENVLATIAQFWGGHAPRHALMHDWYDRYRQIPEYIEQLEVFREHVNERYALNDIPSGRGEKM